MPKWLPDTKPAWWDTIVEFGKNPKQTVSQYIATFIATGVLLAWTYALENLRVAYDAFSLGIDALLDGLLATVEAWRISNEFVILAWQRTVRTFLGTSVFTPVIVSVLGIALLVAQSWLLYRGVLYFADYVPYLEGILK